MRAQRGQPGLRVGRLGQRDGVVEPGDRVGRRPAGGGRTATRSPPSRCPRRSARWRGRPRWRPRAGTRRPRRAAAPPRPRPPPAAMSSWRHGCGPARPAARARPSSLIRVARRASVSTIRAWRPSTSGSSGIEVDEQGAPGAWPRRRGPRARARPADALCPSVKRRCTVASTAGSRSGSSWAARHLVRDGVVGQAALGAHEPLRHRRLGDEEQPGHLGGRQAAQRPQRERHPALDRERRVAGREHQAQEVVADDLRVRVVPAVEGGEAPVGGALLVVPLGVSPEPVDRLVAGGRGDPRAGLVGDPGPSATARGRPRTRPAPRPRRGRGRRGRG